MKTKTSTNYPYQVFLVDFLIFVASVLLYVFICRTLLSYDCSSLTKDIPYLFIPLFIIAASAIIIPLYIELKHNKLSFKSHRLFLYIGLVIALTNIIAISILPDEITISADTIYIYEFTPLLRVYAILLAIATGFLPYLFFYLLPRRIRYQKYINYIAYVYLIALVILIIASFFTDYQNYIYLITNKFSDISTHSINGLSHKTVFGTQLMIGAFALILLEVINKKPLWLFLIIPILGFQLLAFAKMPFILTLLVTLIYLARKLIIWIRRDHQNLIVTLFVFGFIIIPLLIIFMVALINVQSGTLYNLKNTFTNSIKTNWNNRVTIWTSALNAFGPAQIVFGYGLAISGNIVHYAYTYNFNCQEGMNNAIYHAHNTWIQFVLDGGIIYALINLFLFGYLIYITLKIRNKHSDLAFISMCFIIAQLLNGIVEYNCFLNDTTDFYQNFIVILPVMGVYYMHFDKLEKEIRLKIIDDAKNVKNISFDQFYLKLEKKLLLHSSYNISEDIKNEKSK